MTIISRLLRMGRSIPALGALLTPVITAHAAAAPAAGGGDPLPPSGSAYFEPNVGQAPPSVHYLSRSATQNLLVTDDGLWFRQPDGAGVGLQLVGARKLAPRGVERLAGTSNYQVGTDASQWRSAVPHFGRLVSPAVYPSIDLVAYAHERDLEYDFVVAPGGDPRQIRLRFPGASRVTLDSNGDLLIETPSGTVRNGRPVAYQLSPDARGAKQLVGARYDLRSNADVGIVLDGYDRRRTLVIDPVLSTTKRFGGSGNEQATDIAVDGAGNVYVTGFTEGRGFPTLNGAQTTVRGDVDAFVSKFNSSGTLLYSTYYGGNGEDVGRAIAVDSGGRAFVVGATKSTNLTTVGAFQSTKPSGNGSFLLVLSAGGNSIAYASYLGGASADAELRVSDVGVGSDGTMWLTGQTTNTTFPFTLRGFQTTHAGGTYDAFVMRVNPSLSGVGSVLAFTFYGGGGDDHGRRLVRRGGDFFVGGDTNSMLPLGTPFGPRGDDDIFVIAVTSALGFSGGVTFGGKGSELLRGLGLDSSGNMYVSGETVSLDLPITAGASQRELITREPYPGIVRSDVFVCKLNAGGTSLGYLTYLGGTNVDVNSDLAVTPTGTVYVTGTTYSDDFPPGTSGPALARRNAFVTQLNSSGGRVSSMLLGGSSVDDGVGVAVSGTNLWVGATSLSSSFQGASAPLGNWDALLTKMTLP